MRRLPLAAAMLAGAMALLGTGCDYLAARDHLNKGVASMKTARYKEATEHFKEAIARDPDWEVPKLYLATAYLSQWIPGAESAENREFANQARAGFMKVLEAKPDDKNALAYRASMAYSEATTGTPTPEEKKAKLDESASWHTKRNAVEPSAEAYYSLAVISYIRWVPDWLGARTASKMRQEDPGPLKDKKIRDELSAKDSMLVDEAIANLNKSLELNPEYEDAMTYMGIFLREQADMLEDKAEYEKRIAQAEEWSQKSMDTRKIKAQRAAKKAGGGIVQEAPK
jgi:tetratricopeptide (TPR) repeat protein